MCYDSYFYSITFLFDLLLLDFMNLTNFSNDDVLIAKNFFLNKLSFEEKNLISFYLHTNPQGDIPPLKSNLNSILGDASTDASISSVALECYENLKKSVIIKEYGSNSYILSPNVRIRINPSHSAPDHFFINYFNSLKNYKNSDVVSNKFS